MNKIKFLKFNYIVKAIDYLINQKPFKQVYRKTVEKVLPLSSREFSSYSSTSYEPSVIYKIGP